MSSNDCQKLSQLDQSKFDKIFERLSKQVHKYGTKEIDEEYPCLRVRKVKTFKMNEINKELKEPEKLYHYTLGFIKEYKFCPNKANNPGKEISHVCGNASDRKICETNMRQKSLCIEGTHMLLETHDANRKRSRCHKFIRDFEKKYRNNQNVITKGKITVKYINETISDYSIECECENKKCFINYGKI